VHAPRAGHAVVMSLLCLRSIARATVSLYLSTGCKSNAVDASKVAAR
jgi:hypothetical protein